MTVKRDHMNKADTVTVAAIQAGVPSLVEAHALIERFHAMIRKKEADQLDPWIAEAAAVWSHPSRRARERQSRRPARLSSTVVQWSGRGSDHQLKLVKRQMYGRAKLDLLQARLLGAA